MTATAAGHGPAWMSWLGVAAILLGLFFAAHEGNEWMRQQVLDHAAPPGLALPEASCPEDELEEEGLSVAECQQLVSDVRSYLVSRPTWFSSAQSWLAALGTVLAVISMLCGALLVNYSRAGAKLGAWVLAALAALDAGHFVAAQLAGPILRGLHLPNALLWFFVHLSLALAYVAARRQPPAGPVAGVTPAYGRFGVLSHWFVAISIFFLFVSSWWMLALPLPSSVFRFREFPFQLHKNLGITIALFIVAMALVRFIGRQALATVERETPLMHRSRVGAHIALYLLILAVCITGYLSSSYSGWGTTFWWLVDLPYWGHENEELNQLYSDLHLWACWALLAAMAAHIGAALLHAFRNDGVVRRILRW